MVLCDKRRGQKAGGALDALRSARDARADESLDIVYKQYSLRGMWTIVEEREASKVLDKLPRHVGEKYAFWCAIVRQSGPHGLRAIKSFHDEKLRGKLSDLRSSRLNEQWRVLCRVHADVVTVYVERLGPHDYRP
jgi:proteic killer suppression protein